MDIFGCNSNLELFMSTMKLQILYKLQSSVKVLVVSIFNIFICGQFWSSGIVVACVSLSVFLYVSITPELVRAITRHPLKLGSQNLDHRCKTPWLRSLLFWDEVDLDLQGEI